MWNGFASVHIHPNALKPPPSVQSSPGETALIFLRSPWRDEMISQSSFVLSCIDVKPARRSIIFPFLRTAIICPRARLYRQEIERSRIRPSVSELPRTSAAGGIYEERCL